MAAPRLRLFATESKKLGSGSPAWPTRMPELDVVCGFNASITTSGHVFLNGLRLLGDIGSGSEARVRLCRNPATGVRYSVYFYDPHASSVGHITERWVFDHIELLRTVSRLEHRNIRRVRQVWYNKAKCPELHRLLTGSGRYEVRDTPDPLFLGGAASEAGGHAERALRIKKYDSYVIFLADYCDVGSLSSFALRLSYREISHVFHEIARAVQALHAQGIVHRDVKDANILLNSEELYRFPEAFQGEASQDSGSSSSCSCSSSSSSSSPSPSSSLPSPPPKEEARDALVEQPKQTLPGQFSASGGPGRGNSCGFSEAGREDTCRCTRGRSPARFQVDSRRDSLTLASGSPDHPSPLLSPRDVLPTATSSYRYHAYLIDFGSSLCSSREAYPGRPLPDRIVGDDAFAWSNAEPHHTPFSAPSLPVKLEEPRPFSPPPCGRGDDLLSGSLLDPSVVPSDFCVVWNAMPAWSGPGECEAFGESRKGRVAPPEERLIIGGDAGLAGADVPQPELESVALAFSRLERFSSAVRLAAKGEGSTGTEDLEDGVIARLAREAVGDAAGFMDALSSALASPEGDQDLSRVVLDPLISQGDFFVPSAVGTEAYLPPELRKDLPRYDEQVAGARGPVGEHTHSPRSLEPPKGERAVGSARTARSSGAARARLGEYPTPRRRTLDPGSAGGRGSGVMSFGSTDGVDADADAGFSSFGISMEHSAATPQALRGPHGFLDAPGLLPASPFKRGSRDSAADYTVNLFAADVWSYGVTLFYIITGVHRRDPLDRLSNDAHVLATNISIYLADLLCGCLSSDPCLRYTMREVVAHPFFLEAEFQNHKNYAVASRNLRAFHRMVIFSRRALFIRNVEGAFQLARSLGAASGAAGGGDGVLVPCEHTGSSSDASKCGRSANVTGSAHGTERPFRRRCHIRRGSADTGCLMDKDLSAKPCLFPAFDDSILRASRWKLVDAEIDLSSLVFVAMRALNSHFHFPADQEAVARDLAIPKFLGSREFASHGASLRPHAQSHDAQRAKVTPEEAALFCGRALEAVWDLYLSVVATRGLQLVAGFSVWDSFRLFTCREEDDVEESNSLSTEFFDFQKVVSIFVDGNGYIGRFSLSRSSFFDESGARTSSDKLSAERASAESGLARCAQSAEDVLGIAARASGGGTPPGVARGSRQVSTLEKGVVRTFGRVPESVSGSFRGSFSVLTRSSTREMSLGRISRSPDSDAVESAEPRESVKHVDILATLPAPAETDQAEEREEAHQPPRKTARLEVPVVLLTKPWNESFSAARAPASGLRPLAPGDQLRFRGETRIASCSFCCRDTADIGTKSPFQPFPALFTSEVAGKDAPLPGEEGLLSRLAAPRSLSFHVGSGKLSGRGRSGLSAGRGVSEPVRLLISSPRAGLSAGGSKSMCSSVSVISGSLTANSLGTIKEDSRSTTAEAQKAPQPEDSDSCSVSAELQKIIGLTDQLIEAPSGSSSDLRADAEGGEALELPPPDSTDGGSTLSDEDVRGTSLDFRECNCFSGFSGFLGASQPRPRVTARAIVPSLLWRKPRPGYLPALVRTARKLSARPHAEQRSALMKRLYLRLAGSREANSGLLFPSRSNSLFLAGAAASAGGETRAEALTPPLAVHDRGASPGSPGAANSLVTMRRRSLDSPGRGRRFRHSPHGAALTEEDQRYLVSYYMLAQSPAQNLEVIHAQGEASEDSEDPSIGMGFYQPAERKEPSPHSRPRRSQFPVSRSLQLHFRHPAGEHGRQTDDREVGGGTGSLGDASSIRSGDHSPHQSPLSSPRQLPGQQSAELVGSQGDPPGDAAVGLAASATRDSEAGARGGERSVLVPPLMPIARLKQESPSDDIPTLPTTSWCHSSDFCGDRPLQAPRLRLPLLLGDDGEADTREGGRLSLEPVAADQPRADEFGLCRSRPYQEARLYFYTTWGYAHPFIQSLTFDPSFSRLFRLNAVKAILEPRGTHASTRRMTARTAPRAVALAPLHAPSQGPGHGSPRAISFSRNGRSLQAVESHGTLRKFEGIQLFEDPATRTSLSKVPACLQDTVERAAKIYQLYAQERSEESGPAALPPQTARQTGVLDRRRTLGAFARKGRGRLFEARAWSRSAMLPRKLWLLEQSPLSSGRWLASSTREVVGASGEPREPREAKGAERTRGTREMNEAREVPEVSGDLRGREVFEAPETPEGKQLPQNDSLDNILQPLIRRHESAPPPQAHGQNRAGSPGLWSPEFCGLAGFPLHRRASAAEPRVQLPAQEEQAVRKGHDREVRNAGRIRAAREPPTSAPVDPKAGELSMSRANCVIRSKRRRSVSQAAPLGSRMAGMFLPQLGLPPSVSRNRSRSLRGRHFRRSLDPATALFSGRGSSSRAATPPESASARNSLSENCSAGPEFKDGRSGGAVGSRATTSPSWPSSYSLRDIGLPLIDQDSSFRVKAGFSRCGRQGVSEVPTTPASTTLPLCAEAAGLGVSFSVRGSFSGFQRSLCASSPRRAFSVPSLPLPAQVRDERRILFSASHESSDMDVLEPHKAMSGAVLYSHYMESAIPEAGSCWDHWNDGLSAYTVCSGGLAEDRAEDQAADFGMASTDDQPGGRIRELLSPPRASRVPFGVLGRDDDLENLSELQMGLSMSERMPSWVDFSQLEADADSATTPRLSGHESGDTRARRASQAAFSPGADLQSASGHLLPESLGLLQRPLQDLQEPTSSYSVGGASTTSLVSTASVVSVASVASVASAASAIAVASRPSLVSFTLGQPDESAEPGAPAPSRRRDHLANSVMSGQPRRPVKLGSQASQTSQSSQTSHASQTAQTPRGPPGSPGDLRASDLRGPYKGRGAHDHHAGGWFKRRGSVGHMLQASMLSLASNLDTLYESSNEQPEGSDGVVEGHTAGPAEKATEKLAGRGADELAGQQAASRRRSSSSAPRPTNTRESRPSRPVSPHALPPPGTGAGTNDLADLADPSLRDLFTVTTGKVESVAVNLDIRLLEDSAISVVESTTEAMSGWG